MERSPDVAAAVTTPAAASNEATPALWDGLASRPIIIQEVAPQVDDGRYPVKREVGDLLEVSATIFRDGHDKLCAVLLWRRLDETEWRETPMALVNPGLDRWTGRVVLTENTTYVYTVEAWTDAYESWCL
jgi:starch synthase (maltosyl-transferring)